MEVRYLRGLTMQNVQTVLLMICVLFSTAVPALSDQRATVEDIRCIGFCHPSKIY